MSREEETRKLKLFVQESGDDQLKADAIIKILENFEGDRIEKEAYTNQLRDLAVKLSSPLYKAWSELYESAQHCSVDDLNKEFAFDELNTATELINSAFGIFSQLNNLSGVSASYMIYGNIEHGKKNYPAAIEYYFKAAEIRENSGDKTLPDSYFMIALNCGLTQNFDMTFKYLEKASALYESTGNKRMLAKCYSNFGAWQYGHKNIQLALEYHLKSLNVAKEIADKSSLSFSYYWVGVLYLDKEEYTLSEQYFDKAVEICIEISNNHILTYSYIGLAKLHKIAGSFSLAEAYLDKATEIIKQVVNRRWERALYYAKYELNKAEGNAAAALDYYEKYTEIFQEIENKNFTEQMAEVKFKNDIEKKEKEVEMERKMRNVVEEKNKIIEEEKKKADDLLLNILPAEVAEELKEKGTAGAKLFDDVTVLFTDFKDFTKVAERLTPQQLVDELHACFSAFDQIVAKYKIEKIKTVGDAYLAVSGLPHASANHAKDLVGAAVEIRDFMLNRKLDTGNRKPETFEVRIGVHSGSVVAGIVGLKKFAYDIWGDTVNTAARMEQNSEAGKINISEATYLLVKDKFNCQDRGELEAKNKGRLRMYFVDPL